MTGRVVSLLASGTEIVCALGAGDLLVGRSHECDNPPWVRALPACSAPAFDITGSSRAIDEEVRRRLAAQEPLYTVDRDLIRRLAPDLVITQSHCAVCAVTPADIACDAPVGGRDVVLTAATLGGVFAGVRQVGAALGLSEAAEALVRGLESRLASVADEVGGRPRPTVVLLEWMDPLFTSGNWGPELVEAAGACPKLAVSGQHSTAVPWSDVVHADPDWLIVAPCGFSLERTLTEVGVLEQLPDWFDLRAVRSGRVVLADGNLYFNRSGVTVADTIELLARVLHGVPTGDAHLAQAWCAYEP